MDNGKNTSRLVTDDPKYQEPGWCQLEMSEPLVVGFLLLLVRDREKSYVLVCQFELTRLLLYTDLCQHSKYH